jgi:hypothetical protein
VADAPLFQKVRTALRLLKDPLRSPLNAAEVKRLHETARDLNHAILTSQ